MYSGNFKTYRLKEFRNPCCLRASGGGVINHITASLGSYVNGIDERGGGGGREKKWGNERGRKGLLSEEEGRKREMEQSREKRRELSRAQPNVACTKVRNLRDSFSKYRSQ